MALGHQVLVAITRHSKHNLTHQQENAPPSVVCVRSAVASAALAAHWLCQVLFSCNCQGPPWTLKCVVLVCEDMLALPPRYHCMQFMVHAIHA